MIEWQWKQFENLNIDQFAWHLSGWKTVENSNSRKLVAYCRVVYPTCKYKEPSIGRFLTVKTARKTGLGKQLLSKALINTEKEYPDKAIKISAQLYLQNFYSQFGFEKNSKPYDEDGIPHIEMLRKAT
jgi:ElaA protein